MAKDSWSASMPSSTDHLQPPDFNAQPTSSAPPSPLLGADVQTTDTPLLCSIPGSLTHAQAGKPTEVETILHKLNYPPTLVKIVAIYKITTREEFLHRLKIERNRLKWELGMHKTPFEKSKHSPKKERLAPEKCDLPANTFVELMERSKSIWPKRQLRRKESVDEIVARVPQIWGQNCEEIQDQLRTLLPVADTVPTRPGGLKAHKRSLSDPPTTPCQPDPTNENDDPSTQTIVPLWPSKVAMSVEKDMGAEDEISDLDIGMSEVCNEPCNFDLSLRQRFLSSEVASADNGESVNYYDPCSDNSIQADAPAGRRKRLPSAPTIPRELRKATSMAA